MERLLRLRPFESLVARPRRGRPTLPLETIAQIFDHVCADAELVAQRPEATDRQVRQKGDLREHLKTGLAVARVSRSFLPFGRRMLYSHICTKETQAFWRALELLRSEEGAELRAFVRTLTVDFRRSDDAKDPCTRPCYNEVRMCAATESASINLIDVGENEVASEDSHKIFDLFLINFGKHCRHLTLAFNHSSFATNLAACLGHFSDLKSLTLRRVTLPHLEYWDCESGRLLSVKLKSLRYLDLKCGDIITVTSLLEAAPNLAELSLTLNLPSNIPTPDLQPNFSIRQLVLRIRFENEPPLIDSLAYLERMVSSFPNIKRLGLRIKDYYGDRVDAEPSVSLEASQRLLCAIPQDIEAIHFGGGGFFLFAWAFEYQFITDNPRIWSPDRKTHQNRSSQPLPEAKPIALQHFPRLRELGASFPKRFFRPNERRPWDAVIEYCEEHKVVLLGDFLNTTSGIPWSFPNFRFVSTRTGTGLWWVAFFGGPACFPNHTGHIVFTCCAVAALVSLAGEFWTDDCV
ncbi:hypothetical protein P7C70_g4406, partial [Phenoliferia sp. Uapishka_3]